MAERAEMDNQKRKRQGDNAAEGAEDSPVAKQQEEQEQDQEQEQEQEQEREAEEKQPLPVDQAAQASEDGHGEEGPLRQRQRRSGAKEAETQLRDRLWPRWRAMCDRMQLSEPHVTDWGERVFDLYCEPHRRYHTLEHVANMLAMCDALPGKDSDAPVELSQLRDEELVVLSTMFHDVIYDPTSGTNEEDSASLLREFARAGGLSAKREEMAAQYILETKRHAVHESADEDLKVFIDLDMAILGAPEEEYLRYADNIRREYAHVPWATYCDKRAQVLRTMLEKPIFATRAMAEWRGEQAVRNLRQEIERLGRADAVDPAR